MNVNQVAVQEHILLVLELATNSTQETRKCGCF